MWFSDVLMPIIIELSKNAVLLLMLSVLYNLTNVNPDTSIQKKFVTGLVLGMIVVFLMMTAWKVQEGLIFDMRSVVLVISGVFFGGIPTIVAATIALIYRVFFVSSFGVYAGVLTIISTSTLGLCWHQIRKLFNFKRRYVEYYMLGLFAHILTVLSFLAIPWPQAFTSIGNTAAPFLGIFPIITMGLALMVHNQKDRLISNFRLSEQRALLQASIDAPKSMEIFALNRNYQYLSYNHFHQKSMWNYYKRVIQIGEKYLDVIVDQNMKHRIKNLIDIALSGEAVNRVIEVENVKDKYLEELYSPIFDEHQKVIGVNIISQDISERKRYEESILYLSYKDPLTSLYNRRFYQEELAKVDHPKYYPLSIVLIDINGLKIMNDAFGHAAGDALLCTVADEIRNNFKTERIARIGGDEFVIIMPNTSYEDAQKMIDDAKRHMERNQIHGMTTSVAFGLSTKNDEKFLDEVIKAAEDDMYAHKLFEISSHRNETIKTIVKTLHEKNPREEMHSERVSLICTSIGKALGMKQNDINLLKAISNLHDIGKIAIDDAILNKPGKLTEDEWEQIKRHPEIGYRILSSTPEYAEIAQDILCHHERYDGNGYPRGLKGNEIPLRARIITLADSYDAMISDRPYRKAMTHDEAVLEITRCSGSQFDPKIVEVFIKSFQKKPKVKA